MFGETSVEFYLEGGIGPLSEVIEDSGLTLQWGPSNEKDLDDLKSAVENNTRVIESRATRSGFCITIAITMLVAAVGTNLGSPSSVIVVTTSVANIITGIVFCFPEGESNPEPVIDDGGFGMHVIDYIQHHIYYLIDVIRILELQKVYIQRLWVALEVQKCLMITGLAFLIAGVVS